MQAVDAPVSGLYLPATQFSQELDPALVLNVPGPHNVQATAAAAAVCWPAAHSEHAADPAAGANCPAAQSWHASDLVLPLLAANVPASHSRQDVAPIVEI